MRRIYYFHDLSQLASSPVVTQDNDRGKYVGWRYEARSGVRRDANIISIRQVFSDASQGRAEGVVRSLLRINK